MARPRTQPEPEISDDEPRNTVRLKYDGPEGQVVVGLGELVPGETYDVDEEIAAGLVDFSPHWKEA